MGKVVIDETGVACIGCEKAGWTEVKGFSVED